MAPVMPCVVEIGKPRRVARITVVAAPRATARRNCSEPTSVSGTRPLPENFFSKACARKIDAIDPANVVIVAQLIAVR
jgi:hypothetical protein